MRLWDSTESAHLEWQQLGQPSRQRFGLTVKDGWHAAWLDRPDGPHRWGLNL